MNQNHDPQELEKFARQAAHWWDPHGGLKTLHQINPLRLRYIKENITLSGKSIIDIGCGGGILAESLAQEGAHVTGIDMNPSLIEVARLHQLESGIRIEYLETTAETIAAERPAQYDVITCLEMLEHVPGPCSIIHACAKLVKPGGHLFFSTLNRNPKSYFFAILGAEYLLGMLPENTHDYAKFIKPSELANWIREANLQPKETKGMSWRPFAKTFQLTDDVSINYLLHAQKEPS